MRGSTKRPCSYQVTPVVPIGAGGHYKKKATSPLATGTYKVSHPRAVGNPRTARGRRGSNTHVHVLPATESVQKRRASRRDGRRPTSAGGGRPAGAQPRRPAGVGFALIAARGRPSPVGRARRRWGVVLPGTPSRGAPGVQCELIDQADLYVQAGHGDRRTRSFLSSSSSRPPCWPSVRRWRRRERRRAPRPATTPAPSAARSPSRQYRHRRRAGHGC